MPYVPQDAIDTIKNNPNLTARELFDLKQLGTSYRTARRWCQYVREGTASAVPHHHAPQFDIPTEGEPVDLDIDDILRHARALAGYRQQIDPIVTHCTITIPETTRPIGVMFVSCAHLGGRYTHYEKFLDIYNRLLETDGLYIVSLGDDIEGFIPTFKDKMAIRDQILTVEVQHMLMAHVVGELAGAGKLLAGMSSQHGDQWQERTTGTNPIKEVYTSNGIPFFDGLAYVKLVVGNQTYNIAMGHQFPGYSMYNPLHAHMRAMRDKFPLADVIVQGDKHNSAVFKQSVYTWEVDAGNRPSPYIYFVQVGTAKNGPDKFAIKNWGHGIFEWPVMILNPAEHGVLDVTEQFKTVDMWLSG